MATTEHARRRLYQRLSDLIGSDEADTLMELLPPTGWADVATKHDLGHQTDLTDARFDRIDARFEQVDARFRQIDARFDRTDAELARRFDQLHATIDLKLDASESRVLAELHRSLRTNLLVTVGMLGTLTAVVGVFTGVG